MDLNDFEGGKYSWYCKAVNLLEDYIDISINDFGEGRDNTKYMIEKWNEMEYGYKTSGDLWEIFNEIDSNVWFIPSKSEWSAFGGNLNITVDKCDDYNFSSYYWTSSQASTRNAYRPRLGDDSNMGGAYIASSAYIRLSTTF